MPASVQPKAHSRQTRAVRPKYRRRRVLRPLLDAVVAGFVFTLVSTTLMCTHARAGTTPAAFAGIKHAATPTAITTTTSSATAVYRQTSVTAAWALLGVAFSLLTALNLAMLRHLKRVYAMPMRRCPQPR
jgi:hypothetical protein